MKAIVIVMLVSVLGTATAVFGDSRRDGQPPAESGATREGCRLSAAADRSSYAFGQPIIIRLTTENAGTKAVSVFWSYPMEVYRFEIRNADGKTVPLTLEGERLASLGGFSMAVVPLEPGDPKVDVVPMLNRWYDMTLQGDYTVVVHRRVLMPGASKPIELGSNTLKIAIRDGASSGDGEMPRGRESSPVKENTR